MAQPQKWQQGFCLDGFMRPAGPFGGTPFPLTVTNFPPANGERFPDASEINLTAPMNAPASRRSRRRSSNNNYTNEE
ncbi:MAG TPA: hypothetical protein VGJ73_05235 [Verrucomicrobiae bacterium]|jgi:hypothetical protein